MLLALRVLCSSCIGLNYRRIRHYCIISVP